MIRALVLVLVSTTARADTPPPPAKPKAPYGAVAVIEKPIAMVGATILWESEVEARMKPIDDKSTRPKIVDEMIDDLVYLARADQLRITVEPSEIAAAMEEIKRQNGIDDAAFDKVLADNGFTRKKYEVELGRQLLRLRVRNQEVLNKLVIPKADIDAELAKQGLSDNEQNRGNVQTKLKVQRSEKAGADYIATMRKRIHVEVFR